ncbi:MAG: DNA polymerase III subunit alpha [Actinomycetales bacterium]|nr:DNA polymerase III subunit alpha [Actinomycetales bacterium]
MSFCHLQVASGFSLQYGTAMPGALVSRAAELGQPIVGLTDRDGLYGAVRWALACREAGVRPVLGVDLAMEETRPVTDPPGPTRVRRSPARGGTWVREDRPRVLLLAADARGWASLCRLVSAAHTGAHTERGAPWLTWAALRDHHEGVVALLPLESEVGRLLATGRVHRAPGALRPWRAIFGRRLGLAVASHRQPTGLGRSGRLRHSTAAAAAMLGWARQESVPVVLTNAVRYLDAEGAKVADVLDSARRLVPLNSRHIDADNGEAFLKDARQMAQVADEIATAAGERDGGRRLLADTRRLAEFCALDPAADLGIGEVFVPELDVLLQQEVPPEEAASRADALLRQRCEAVLPQRYPRADDRREAQSRLEEELRTITHLQFSGYFLTVAEVVTMIKERGVRVAARGSGAGSLVTHLLGISGVDPIRHGLIMERFLSPLRRALPDIDIDVESARREEIYQWIFDRFGSERTAAVSMMETYRVRHAVRDVGSALGFPAGEVDAFAKSFPHIRARDARSALNDLPELRASGFGRLAASGQLDSFLDLVERLDGLPRHVALHPCGVLLSDATLLDRTPVETSAAGFPMSHFDKDDVEEMGLLKLDVLGVRMQSAMAHAIDEIERTTGERIVLDDHDLDDPETFALIQSARTLGCFQIESPGQRELIGKFAPETFGDIIIDISLFRPGPVKSDMVTPFLRARQGWSEPVYVHDDLRPALAETFGVVVFHEQVLRIVATMTGCSLAEADETRRALGSPTGQDDIRAWFYPTALRKGYDLSTVERVWDVLRAFASFGFCKAHAAAFALPTYQSAWLKAHHPAAFYAGVLTHDPGMYPKRLILDDARNFGIAVLGLDVNASADVYRVEPVVVPEDEHGEVSVREGIRVPLTDVKGISEEEVAGIIGGQPYASLADAWQRSGMSRPTAERLIVAGAFDRLYGLDIPTTVRRRGRLTRRDLLLQVADLERWTARSARRSGRGSAKASPRGSAGHAQLTLALADDVAGATPSGLPEMTSAERVHAELEVLGMDVSRHVVDFHAGMLDDLAAAGLPFVRAHDLLRQRSTSEVLVAGVKVATQTPPVRSGRRVIFLTLDDTTGPIDATFFEDAQAGYAGTVFDAWLLLVRGEVRRTGRRGISLRATGCWELGAVRREWLAGGAASVARLLATVPAGAEEAEPVRRRVLVHASGFRQSPYADIVPQGEDVRRAPVRKLWHASPGSSGW